MTIPLAGLNGGTVGGEFQVTVTDPAGNKGSDWVKVSSTK